MTVEIPKEFCDMIKADIQEIDDCLKAGDSTTQWELFRRVDGRYQACIKNWYYGMAYANSDCTNLRVANLMTRPNMVTQNLILAKAKLETYQYKMNAVSPAEPTTQVNVTNTNTIGLNLTFDEAREDVKNMTSLTDADTDEILKRIQELEKVVNSGESKKSKWEKAKPVLKWLADKSFDIGKIILPLILKIQN